MTDPRNGLALRLLWAVAGTLAALLIAIAGGWVGSVESRFQGLSERQSRQGERLLILETHTGLRRSEAGPLP